jgi:N-hydroxyarylamine O-acetyltransferase
MSIDLDAYCRRIGYTGERVPTIDTLRAVHQYHPQAIAFENLDPLLKRIVHLDAASLAQKMLTDARGGYCFEQNLLFGYALDALGFKVRWLTGRTRWGAAKDAVKPRTHMLLLVEAEGRSFLADVGFGANTLTGPLLLDSRDEQPTPHERFLLVEAGEQLIMQVKVRNAWSDLYGFDLSEQLLPDLETGNWYASTHPSSRFVNELMVTRAEPNHRYALHNNELSVHRRNGETEKQTLRSVPELRDALTDLFKLRLAGLEGLDPALARLTGGST